MPQGVLGSSFQLSIRNYQKLSKIPFYQIHSSGYFTYSNHGHIIHFHVRTNNLFTVNIIYRKGSLKVLQALRNEEFWENGASNL